MPEDIANTHSLLIDNFINKKNNQHNIQIQKTNIFAINKNRFIFPIYFHIDFSFQTNSDFFISAIISRDR